MKEKPISTLETKDSGCLVAVGASILLIILGLMADAIYALPLIFVYSLLAYPFGFVGASIGKKFAKTRISLWVGAMIAMVLEFWLLYSITSTMLLD